MIQRGNKAQVKVLAEAVERLHSAQAVFLGTELVHEEFNGATVWRGLVSQF